MISISENEWLFTPTHAAGLFQEWDDKQILSLVMESARWGDYHRPNQPYWVDVEWPAEVDRMLNNYFSLRAQKALNQMNLQLMPPTLLP